MADVPTIEIDDSDIINDPTDVKDEVVVDQDPTPAEPSTEESKQPAQPESSDTEETDAADPEAQEADSEPSDDTESEQKPEPTGAEKRKAELEAEIANGKEQLGIDPNTEIRDLVSARKAIKEEVERQNAQVYTPRSTEQIMEEDGLDEVRAEVKSMKEANEVRDYNDSVVEGQLFVSSESQRVLQDFPMFNPTLADGTQNPNYQPQLAQQAAQLLEANLIRDPNVAEIATDPRTGQPYYTGKGVVTGSRVSPYQIYKPIADSARMAAENSRVQAQRNTEQMMASAEPQSSIVPAEPKEDPFLTGLTKGIGT
jgi:hypothetical protein